jgi:glucose/arabinose dehydrogenase
VVGSEKISDQCLLFGLHIRTLAIITDALINEIKICLRMYLSLDKSYHVGLFLKLFIIVVLILFIIHTNGDRNYSIYGQYSQTELYSHDKTLPYVTDDHLSVELVYSGLNGSTNMAFLDANDILILEQVSAKVVRIVNHNMLDEPLIDLNSYFQDGLVGIATAPNQNGSTSVFLYFNEAPVKYGADVDNVDEAIQVNQTLGYNREGDRLYRFELVNNSLVHPKLLIDLKNTNQSTVIGDKHHGGEVIIGPDKAVYVVVGDLDGWKYDQGKTKAQNYKDWKNPDGRAGILRVTQDGKPVNNGILGNIYPLNLYYAYGIRNSFGMDFDPVTGNLWDTENGPDYGDEINLVKPGFNSGTDVVEGGMSTEDNKLDNFVEFNGKGKYSEPEFAWNVPVAPTALKFFNSDKFGVKYKNDMFVADNNHGIIYHFDLTESRTSLSLDGKLEDKVANIPPEVEEIVFARNFPGITDLQVSPDGYLYVLASGNLYKIGPK